MRRFNWLVVAFGCLGCGCSDEPAASGESGGAPGAQAAGAPAAQAGDAPIAPPSGPKVAAQAGPIREMLGEKFGRAVRAVRIAVEADGDDVRVKLRGEVPSEKIRDAVMAEVAARVEGLRVQDFELVVSGPAPLIGIIEAQLDDDQSAIFTRDLRLAATFGRSGGSTTRTPTLWDLWTGRPVNELNPEGLEQFRVMAFSPDGKTLATGHAHAQIVLWDLPLADTHTTLEKPRDVLVSNDVGAITFSADGRFLASVLSAKGEVWLWDLQSRQARLVGSHDPNLNYVLAFSPDGKILASAEDRSQTVTVWDLAARGSKRTFKDDIHVEAIAWSPDSRSLAAGRTTQGQGVVVWEVASGKARRLNPEGQGLVRDLAFSPDGRMLAALHDQLGVFFWDLETGKEWTRLDVRKVGVSRGMAFSAGGGVLAVACYEMEPWTIAPPGFQFWDVSRRPGAGAASGDFPPKSVEPLPMRNDLLVARMNEAVQRGEGVRARNVRVELLEDGSVRMTGSVPYERVKENLERMLRIHFRIPDRQGRPGVERRIVNELKVELPPEMRGLQERAPGAPGESR